ncbi:MAG: ABC transporter ATP-binding protein [Candidatus Cloacimonadota bacterium]|nr:ABC transporter ATP-binding protein [Candidatus Cloacimonadota bacterium]
MDENIIEARHLTKHYSDFTAVDDISFKVQKGEIFGFLGPNGAGKTTTINMLIGMAKISSGKVFYHNEDVTKNMKKAQSLIGVVADESNLYAEMNGYENLCFCGALYGMKKQKRKKRANLLLDMFALSEFRNRKFQAYSKGMKRKLTIAAGLMHKPEILFLDEPTTGIDVATVRQIRELIRELNKNGTTIFLTTHYIEEAERLCHRIAFIKTGKIIELDSKDNMLEKTKDKNRIEISFAAKNFDTKKLSENLINKFPSLENWIHNKTTIEFSGKNNINIVPIINYLDNLGFKVIEAKVMKPSLEDIFVELTGIEANIMKKEKERK